MTAIPINHWYCVRCKPKQYNDALTTHCIICGNKSPITETYRNKVRIYRGAYLDLAAPSRLVTEKTKVMTEQEELFKKFFNSEKLLVKDMDDIQLRDHRDELSRIAFEAKARLVAADEETRSRKPKREWLVTTEDADVNVSEAINAVKTRKARMTKMDKLAEQLLKTGIDQKTVNGMIKDMEAKASGKKLITFNKKTEEMSAVEVDSVEPFDPSKLKFGV